MLVKFDSYLVERLTSWTDVKNEEPPPMAVVGTENGVVKIPFSKKEWIETENITEMMPDWLREALVTGPIVSMSNLDFDSLPMEVQQYGEIIHY